MVEFAIFLMFANFVWVGIILWRAATKGESCPWYVKLYSLVVLMFCWPIVVALVLPDYIGEWEDYFND